MQGVPLGSMPLRMSIITTDASRMGLGVSKAKMARGVWEPPWDTKHINVLELRTVYPALGAFLPFIYGWHVPKRMISSSNIHNINHKGGHKFSSLSQGCTEGSVLDFSMSGLIQDRR